MSTPRKPPPSPIPSGALSPRRPVDTPPAPIKRPVAWEDEEGEDPRCGLVSVDMSRLSLSNCCTKRLMSEFDMCDRRRASTERDGGGGGDDRSPTSAMRPPSMDAASGPTEFATPHRSVSSPVMKRRRGDQALFPAPTASDRPTTSSHHPFRNHSSNTPFRL
jgi:hypothetical protein